MTSPITNISGDQKRYFFKCPLRAAWMAMVFHVRMRVENNYGTFMPMGDWLVLSEREKIFRRAWVHSLDVPIFKPKIGDIIKYWQTTEPDYFSQSTAARTKEHIKRLKKHTMFYIEKGAGISKLKIIQRDEIAFYEPEDSKNE